MLSCRDILIVFGVMFWTYIGYVYNTLLYNLQYNITKENKQKVFYRAIEIIN